MQRVLFVCLGNICRSPAAEGVMRKLAADRGMRLALDSAGTGGWHVGALPDARMRKAAAARGYDLDGLSARKVALADFYEFDRILAMDESNLADLREMEPANAEAAVGLFLDFARRHDEREVPDPYYGGPEGFDHVLDLIEDAAHGLLDGFSAAKG